MKKAQRLLGGFRREDGITGLETAIILIAFVVVATIFAFVVLTTGVFSGERGKEDETLPIARSGCEQGASTCPHAAQLSLAS